MNWINLQRAQRISDVSAIDDRIESQCPDRFWLSDDQDGDDTQEMHILLPYGTDQYFSVHIVTAQLKALRMLASTYGYDPVKPVLSQDLLDRMGIIGEEQFEVSSEHDAGIRYDVVLDVPGLNHVILDSLLDDFLRRDGVPPQPKKINPVNLVKRLLKAEAEGKLGNYRV